MSPLQRALSLSKVALLHRLIPKMGMNHTAVINRPEAFNEWLNEPFDPRLASPDGKG